MRKLRFVYEMNLQFQAPVREHYFALRCVPSSDEVQKITVRHKFIYPADCLDEVTDGFGNRKYVGHCFAEHSWFGYKIMGEAEVEGMKVRRERLHPMYRYPSSFTRTGAALTRYLKEIAPPGGKPLKQALYMMDCLYRDFRYVPGRTDIHTTAEEAMAQREGVCQDYAHIFLALCRLCGIPARYVNGLMIGEGFTHAWVEIYTGEGWYGLDVTNNLHVDDYYIKLAHGRDYGDCILDKGMFRGGTAQAQKISVNVEEIENG